MKTTGESTFNTSNGIHVPTVSYPSIVAGQLSIPDETGKMKFRYKIRVLTEINGTWHLFPEYCNNWEKNVLRRQVVALPTSISTGGGSASAQTAYVV